MNNQVDSAFPTETLMNEVVTVISENPGIKMSDLERHINMKPVKIKAWLCDGGFVLLGLETWEPSVLGLSLGFRTLPGYWL